MGQKRVKSYRKVAQKTMEKAKKDILKANQQGMVYAYIDRLCREPFLVRLSYYWKIMQRKNPHTGKKVK